ncbi:hypothetical protein FHS31_001071 [Sphingomonas vulcanisoli]|uniref:Uncharacterized protein n=1 Tax=Sphingomonas vulcanisoli TaxID=1658060 RepID=A0ABX0TSH1_9SPHN|nr:hypothetical protein [Sphingomonas vulcanisoli]NIJ07475.1 hypothetical protein [Sphingomonas vulcanisoli]
MFTFDKKDFQRFAVSTVGAVILSAACVIAAVGPVHAADVSQAGNAATMRVAAK